MTEAMPFLQKYDITFLRPPAIGGTALVDYGRNQALAALISLMSSGTTLYRSPTMP